MITPSRRHTNIAHSYSAALHRSPPLSVLLLLVLLSSNVQFLSSFMLPSLFIRRRISPLNTQIKLLNKSVTNGMSSTTPQNNNEFNTKTTTTPRIRHFAIDDTSPNITTETRIPNHTVDDDTSHHKPLVIVIAGPTGVGKSAVAASICHPNRASRILHSTNTATTNTSGRGHVVSADSVQAYKGVNVGANKPSQEERNETPHHLVDVVDANGHYSAADWMTDSLAVIDYLSGRRGDTSDNDEEGEQQGEGNKRIASILQSVSKAISTDHHIHQSDDEQPQPLLPVVVGGTMMYLGWLVHGKPDAPKPSPAAVEQATQMVLTYQAMGEEIGWNTAAEEVSAMGDIFRARVLKLPGRDWYRLRRTLEVALTSQSSSQPQTSLTEAEAEARIQNLFNGQRMGGLSTFRYDVRCFFLCPNQRMQHSHIIDQRCEQMILQGLLNETVDLSLAGDLPPDGQPARAIGYRQALDYLRREDPKPNDVDAFMEFMNVFAASTRQYSKKQMQWFRREKDYMFIPVNIENSGQDRVEDAADLVMNMSLLTRDEYEEELDLNGLDGTKNSKVDDDDDLPLSARTRKMNADQAKGMKFFLSKRHVLLEGSEELQGVLKNADECTARMQGLESL